MGSLESLAHLATDDAMLTSLTTAWETLRETYHETRRETGRETSSSVVSTSAVSSSVTSLPVSVEILGEPSGDDLAFGVDALYVMLALMMPPRRRRLRSHPSTRCSATTLRPALLRTCGIWWAALLPWLGAAARQASAYSRAMRCLLRGTPPVWHRSGSVRHYSTRQRGVRQ